MQLVNTNYVDRNDLVKTCFQHDMGYGKYKDLTKSTESDKILTDKAFEVQAIQNMMHIQEDWFQWFTKFLIKNHWYKFQIKSTTCRLTS